jgi:hypothetical protein
MTIPDTAVPALIGALFGFLASLVKEAFDRRRNAKDRRRELKTAVRMVYAELMFNIGTLNSVREAKLWPSSHHDASIEALAQYNSILARDLRYKTWLQVASGFHIT